MPVHHEINACAGRIEVDLSGTVTRDELLAYVGELAADPLLRPNLTVLADCRDVTGVPSFAELTAVAAVEPRTSRGARPTFAAVLVASPMLFGIARQFAALAEPNGIRVQPFYDRDEAEAWLAAVAEGSSISDIAADSAASLTIVVSSRRQLLHQRTHLPELDDG